MTIAEFDKLDEIEGVKQELIDGELVLTPSPVPRYNLVSSNLVVRLGPLIDQNELGIVLWNQDYAVGDDVLNPNLAFIRAQRAVERDRRPGWVPDLVVEIRSPSNQRKSEDLRAKAKRYLEGGAQAVWLLYPEAGIARIEKPGQPSQVLDVESGGKLEDQDLLPGFSIALADIFE